MKLSCFVGILVLVFSIVGCSSMTVRWLNDNEPVKSSLKWECHYVDDELCVLYLVPWRH